MLNHLYRKLQTASVNYNPLSFKEPGREVQFIEWILPARQNQMAAIAVLTGCLYLANALINYLTETGPVLETMLIVHVFIMPPVLFTISALAYSRRTPSLAALLLSLAPVIALTNSYFILSHFSGITTHLSETYLGLLWIFIVTGLTMAQAVFSALMALAVVVAGTLTWLDLNTTEMTYHFFWVLCSISFGFLGGYLIERAARLNFLNRLRLEELAVTDRLTGLANRTLLNETLERELERSRRFGHPMCVMVLDVDHFKQTNDTWGHNTGDEVLISIARRLQQGISTTDYLFRWGGEEFIIISPESDCNRGLKKAEKLRAAVEAVEFKPAGTKTISIGLTDRIKADTPDTIVRRADQALYQSKANGRNRVTVFE